jgi:hypothetical protein
MQVVNSVTQLPQRSPADELSALARYSRQNWKIGIPSSAARIQGTNCENTREKRRFAIRAPSTPQQERYQWGANAAVGLSLESLSGSNLYQNCSHLIHITAHPPCQRLEIRNRCKLRQEKI